MTRKPGTTNCGRSRPNWRAPGAGRRRSAPGSMGSSSWRDSSSRGSTHLRPLEVPSHRRGAATHEGGPTGDRGLVFARASPSRARARFWRREAEKGPSKRACGLDPNQDKVDVRNTVTYSERSPFVEAILSHAPGASVDNRYPRPARTGDVAHGTPEGRRAGALVGMTCPP